MSSSVYGENSEVSRTDTLQQYFPYIQGSKVLCFSALFRLCNNYHVTDGNEEKDYVELSLWLISVQL